ncbi:methyltransferase domain-containing protein [Paenibacillus sp. CC-CFT747]|nr:methyltransferase domain-containing protein [Paenibacillus sp. CC-CFT747]
MERKHTFNEVAREYDKFRPNYPKELFSEILSYASISTNDRILEIGCGTGKATAGLVNLGYENIVCIELGRNLADLTRTKFIDTPNVKVINSDFESWQNEANTAFSLVISGTAFHFIQPQEVGYRKVFDLLSNQGVIAFFWTVHVPSYDGLFNQIRECYKRYAPHLDDSINPTIHQVIEDRSDLTTRNGLFKDLEVKQYRWNDQYSANEYISLLNTNSRHRQLPEEIRNELFNAIGKTIDEHGGVVVKPQTVILFLARKNL